VGPRKPLQDSVQKPAQESQRQNGDVLNQAAYQKPRPRRAEGGIRARTQKAEAAINWWARRWLRAMENLVDIRRLQRGRSYARQGQVLSFEEIPNGISARVQGSRLKPYRVTVQLDPLSHNQWDQVMDVLAGQAIFAAQLLAGEMPNNIEEAFSAAGENLFPVRAGDVLTSCSCPDWANPCKHIAALHYVLADRFDEDPFLIFRMRGRSQEQILAGLSKRRGGESTSQPVEEEQPAFEEPEYNLGDFLPDFWNGSHSLEDFSVKIQPASIPLPVLKRLGEADFAPQFSLSEELGPAYEAISQGAQLIAFHSTDMDSSLNGNDNGGNG
jgi:uncharacterized Zn finger protein